ncbi:hypothetical protein D3C76_1387140 [compost metagenome]
MIAARYRQVVEERIVVAALLFEQRLAIEHIQVELGQVRGKDTQQLFPLTGRQAIVQPERALRRGRVECVEFDGAELVAIAFRADVA